jgi:tRNA-specific 2-thiouridylase
MRLGLAEKPDSADICFVPGGDYKAFVQSRLPQSAGAVHDERGAVIGQHDGVAGFTLGQRRGLGVAVGAKRFVTSIDPALNIVTIGPEERLYARTFVVDRVNWVGTAPSAPLRVDAKIRYRSDAMPALVMVQPSGSALVEYDEPQRAITPGQAAVFYDGDEVLGGGVIERVED